MQLAFNDILIVNAIKWLETEMNKKPVEQCDFEKEFHCKISENRVIFNSMRDYTWFVLKWQ